MTSIFPVSTGRTSELLQQRRLSAQLQSNQLDLRRLQDQLSTGRRISLPSDDPTAAQRAIEIQRLLEQKAQAKTNLTTSQSFLAATESAISGVNGLLSDIRAAALGAADTSRSDAERQFVAQQVQQAIEQLTEIGNQKFRGRFLFAGSTTQVEPFAPSGNFISYQGNETQVRSYADVDLLFASNLNGNEVFGALSTGAQGAVDLNPSLNADTRLADLHGGAGIFRGPIKISDGSSSRTIDLAPAETLADVARLIEANPPAGRTLTVQITADHLVVSIDNQPGTNLTIGEVEDGTTAADLGILASAGAGNGPVVGEDLNPRLRSTTRLADILGGGFDQTSGLQIVNGGQTTTVDFAAAQTIEDLLNALNGSQAGLLAEINAAGTGVNIRSRLSGADFQIGENGGTTAAQLGVRTFTRESLLADLNHGFGVQPAQQGADFVIHRKDGVDLTINLGSAQSIGDVIDLINNLPGNTDPSTAVVARLASVGNGLELVDGNASGASTLSVTQGPSSTAAWELGLVPRTATTASGIVQGASDVLSGSDVNPLETRGVFNSLVRLKQALTRGDQPQIDRAISLLDDDLSQVSFARADLGARTQALDTIQSRLEDEEVQLRATLSQEIDSDLAEVISELTGKQASVEASLRLIGRTFQLTLLDFL